MILSYSEFTALYDSNNGDADGMYSDGIDIMEALFTVMDKKGVLTETEIVTFLDNVLEETGWDLNEEVYESYAEWLSDWTPFFDEGVNEDESEMIFSLTARGEEFINESKVGDAAKKAGSFISKHAGRAYGGIKTASKAIYKAGRHPVTTYKGVGSKWGKAGMVAGGAAALAGLGYGAYRGVKALKKRNAQKTQGIQKA